MGTTVFMERCWAVLERGMFSRDMGPEAENQRVRFGTAYKSAGCATAAFERQVCINGDR